MSGEQAHQSGREGARRAKKWLEATTRASVHWVNPDGPAVPKLTFSWTDGATFSFDMGGVLQGGILDGHEFLAESKKYRKAQDQGTAYNDFLAKCYRVRASGSPRGDVFMWITWAAFLTNSWDDLANVDRIRKAVIAHRVRALNETDEHAAGKLLEQQRPMLEALSESLWILVLSEKQEEHLVLTPEHQGLIRAHIVQQAASA